MMPEWYDCVESPLTELVHILRNSGFNTTCSCGHYPSPYIEMELYQDDDITRLWVLLTEKGYKNWQVNGYKNQDGSGCLVIRFFPETNPCVDAGEEMTTLVPLKEVLAVSKELRRSQ